MNHVYTQALVADDDPISRGIVSEQLMRLGTKSIRSASSGRQALTALQRDPDIHLLVTDLKMPDMDGIRLLRELGTLERDIDVIIMSALGGKILQAAETLCKTTAGVRVLGVTGKPIELKRLRQMLHTGTEFGDAIPQLRSENPIEAALDGGQHTSVVQSIVDIDDRSCEWVELLSRWSHPLLAQRDPDSIIREAESSELIHSILRHHLRDAGNARKIWQDAKFPVPRISINLSPRHLADRSLPDWSTTVAARFSMQPRHVIFEVAETALADPVAQRMVNALADAGFGIAIDAFGSGDSSVETLQSLPIMALKTDARLIQKINASFEAQMLVESAVQIADTLGVDAIATGVNDAATQDALAEMGYRLMQGRHIGEPIEVEEYPDWVETVSLSAAEPAQAASAA